MYSDMGYEILCDSYQATIPISNAFNTRKKRGKGREDGREREGERETKRGERGGRASIMFLTVGTCSEAQGSEAQLSGAHGKSKHPDL